ncbi:MULTISPECIES: FAD/NAD(P)-binding protein [unclassified Corallococcus]|nr:MULTISPECIES: FAD/NAD(P)-binding protein [unclassified Corallococcus]RKH14301.1 hydroxyacylglutathione hydrolase [Corallococcus sp. CA047B]RKH18956.1 hydroxyacylglutathione hydrolase [Corallococcus sp. CA031C]
MNFRQDVIIIGAGASGTLLAACLLRGARSPLRVTLVEKGERIGRGVAYSTTSSRHLLNVPAGRMSAWVEDPEHFLRWLRVAAPDTPPSAFAERRRYGQYLEAVLTEAAQRAASGVLLETVHDEVTAAVDTGDGVTLSLASGGTLEARGAVLALGNALPADLRVPDGGLYASARYHRSPWAPGALEGIGPEESVLLIGAGLTMVDTVLSLEERGHRGRVHALSRHGLLPHVHRVSGAKAPAAAEPLRIRELLRSVRREMDRCRDAETAHHATAPRDEGAAPFSTLRIRDVLRAMRQEVDAQVAAGADWRAAVDALRPVTTPLWQRLTDAERQRFLRHLRTQWEVHRHRMAPEIHAALETWRREGRLVLHAGRVLGFDLEPDAVTVRLRPRGQREPQVLRVGHVINCTGPESSLSSRSQPLLRGLLEAGQARADSLGMGLSTAGDGAVLDSRGRPSSHLFTLGPPRRGDLWETTAVPEIRAQARDLADHLLRHLGLTRTASVPLSGASS